MEKILQCCLGKDTCFGGKQEENNTSKFPRNQASKTQAPADAAHRHARTPPLREQRRQGLREVSAGDGVPSQPFTVIFSPALAKAELPFLLVLL